MIIKDKSMTFPANDVSLVLLFIFIFGLLTFMMMESKSLEQFPFFCFLFILELIFIIIFLFVIFRYFIHKITHNDITYLDVNENSIDIVYRDKSKIILEKTDISSIVMNITLLEAVATCGRTGIRRKFRASVEYIDFTIYTKDDISYKVRKDFFALYNSAGNFLTQLKGTLKNYEGMYVINFYKANVGFTNNQLGSIENVAIDTLINDSKKDAKNVKMLCMMIIGIIVAPFIVAILFYIYLKIFIIGH